MGRSHALVGDDDLFDLFQEYDVNTDMRFLVVSFLKKWLDNIDLFFRVDKEAVKIVQEIVDNLS